MHQDAGRMRKNVRNVSFGHVIKRQICEGALRSVRNRLRSLRTRVRDVSRPALSAMCAGMQNVRAGVQNNGRLLKVNKGRNGTYGT